ncbi:hypothetical protein FHP29_10595 [Nocardioides albidus]|uniref:Uncharacterized protein n=1 Tax=Nocardioides albidus TaxID=1517589 RepID=A0A5C4VX65_9ACTN|nr:hypothetical protein [Nocardioides albidus]TNM40487.1 hypothetical protein FHP29_10595 [Nocardioides albidus]
MSLDPPLPVNTAPPLQVDLDADLRVVSASFAHLPDELREPTALDAELQRAYLAAVAEGRPTASRSIGPDGRAHAARVTAPPRRPMRELVAEALRDLEEHGAPPRDDHRVVPIGGEQGESDNQCLSVVLDASGAGGRLDADAGWLRQASASNVAAAIQQAFAAAYQRRDHR